MKLIYLTAAVLIFLISTVSAQSIEPWLLSPSKPGINNLFSAKQPTTKFMESPVYVLPQDNMPCLIPPVSNAAMMPVHNPTVTDLYMPNPYFQMDLVSFNRTDLPSKKLPFDPYSKYKARPKF